MLLLGDGGSGSASSCGTVAAEEHKVSKSSG